MEEYPDFNIVGEAWYPNGPAFTAWWQRNSKVNNSNSYLKTVMDFNLTFICQQAFADENVSERWKIKRSFQDI